MLEYSKVILEKVSFDLDLFHKEWKKAIQRLLEPEVEELNNWVIQKFGKKMIGQTIRVENPHKQYRC